MQKSPRIGSAQAPHPQPVRHVRPDPPSPGRPGLWKGVLLGRRAIVPCHFAGVLPWGCNEVRPEYPFGRCQDLSPEATLEERARHSTEHSSASVACSGPAIIVFDLVDCGGGHVAVCAAHRAWLDYHVWLNGSTCQGIIWLQDGVWQTHDGPVVSPEIARWRVSYPGWDQIELGDTTRWSNAPPPISLERGYPYGYRPVR